MFQRTRTKLNLKVLSVCVILLAAVTAYVAGPPSGSTNAPGENSCFGSPSCHSGIPNSGPGFGEMTIMGGVPAGNKYVPNAIYMMMPYQLDTSKQKGGFQSVALLNNGTKAGTPVMTNPSNTQLISSGGRDYVSQTLAGAVSPTTLSMHAWMYEWQAPPPGSGTVTFYTAFAACNNNNSASGDNVYTHMFVLHEDTASGIRDYNNIAKEVIYTAYPVPAGDFLMLDFTTEKALSVEISIFDQSGKIVAPVAMVPLNPPHCTHGLNIERLSPGIYFIKITGEDNSGRISKIVKI